MPLGANVAPPCPSTGGCALNRAVRETWRVLRETSHAFAEDRAMTLAAAVAFYAILSIGPILVLLVWVAGLLGAGAQEDLVAWLTRAVGSRVGGAIQMIANSASQRPDLRTGAGLISVGALVLSASVLFGQLQASMNLVWGVRTKYGHLWSWVRRRLIAVFTALLLGLLLIASVLVSGTMTAVLRAAGDALPGGDAVWWWLNFMTSLVVYSLLFAAVYRALPDVRIAWRHTWFGAFVTSALFSVGKLLLWVYFGFSAQWAAYGAAGSMVMLVVWIYYSAIIFFFGAELTQVVAHRAGRAITPDKHAVWANPDKAV